MKNILLLLLLFGSTTAALRAQSTCDNRCLNFDGKDDYVQLAKSPVQGNINFTIEGWFRSLDNDGLTTCPNGNFERIIGCGGSRLEIGECSGTFAVFIGGSYLTSGVKSGDGLWHYFAVVKDGTTFRVYLDGNTVITYDLPASPVFALDNVFRIGRWAGGGGLTESWQGDIDEIRVWDSALPVEALYASVNCKLRGSETGLKGYYNFDQGVPGGNNVALKNALDLSPSKNNGSMTGFALTGAGSNWVCSGGPHGAFCDDPNKNTPQPISPGNNSVLNLKKGPLPDFSWKWNGALPLPKVYHLQLFRLDSNIRQSVFSRLVDGTSIPAAKVFDSSSPKPGIYQWQLTDTIYGNQSVPVFFTLSDASCGTVSSVLKVECKNEWTPTGLPIYTGTLILTNTATAGTPGCAVKYNTFTAPAGGSISGIFPLLPATIAAGANKTFTFTFIPATFSQTSISVGCYGVWQDAMNNTANLQVNVPLPPCLCKDCKQGDILVSAINVVPGTPPGVFGLTGNLTTNMSSGPITGIEFQVQSVSFSATPSTCSNGVSSVETSGVFLRPASTVNGSTGLVYFNETVSSSIPPPPTNNNAAKDIKWIGSLPAASTIPFNLSVGLPGPLPGLNADCCKIKYRVCIRVTVFFGDNQCRACSVNFCKDFNN